MKKYIIFSVLLIGIISLFVYTQTDATTTFSLFGVSITLLDAVWMAIFLSLFFSALIAAWMVKGGCSARGCQTG